MITLYLVVPCYNEEEVLPETSRRLKDKLTALVGTGKITDKSRVLFVDDGSRDKTWEIICALHDEDERFGGVKLSRNRGHQNALMAGLTTSLEHPCDAVISLDADLQDDIDAIDRMVDSCINGNDVVYGVRSARATDTFFKRTTAQGFYKIMKMLGVDLVYDHADYRLLSRRALEGLMQFDEVNLFLRGIVPQIGYKSDIVTYERGERFAGESKYPLKKMIAFAVEGITSFSVRPVRLITAAGIGIFAVSALVWLILLFTSANTAVKAAASLWTLGGIQLTALGVVGEYVGRVYQETKHRPRFIIEKTVLR